MPPTSIDLNCDMGESFGAYKLGRDEEVMPLISSANIACGFHAGDPGVMRRTVELAKRHGVGVGAHPGLPDLAGFGRRRMFVSPEEIRDIFTYQIGALRGFTDAAGVPLRHVKMHGALFEMALADEALARAMCEATRSAGRDLIWLCPAGRAADVAREMGLPVAEEFYADRAYTPDKRLVSRSRPGAVLHDPIAVRARVAEVLETGEVATFDGGRVVLAFQSICVHGDTPGAFEMVKAIREACAEKGIAVKPLGSG